MGRFLARAWVLAVLLCWPWLGTSPAAAANVVLLLMDDAAASDVADMPTVRQLAREGATFDHAYTPSPMCAPSRAIVQTGLYSHRNGVTQNGVQQFLADGDLTRTFAFAFALHNAGADTRFVGKFINGAPASVPGWDSFAVHLAAGDDNSSVYYNYSIRLDGRTVAHGSAPADYSTDVDSGLA